MRDALGAPRPERSGWRDHRPLRRRGRGVDQTIRTGSAGGDRRRTGRGGHAFFRDGRARLLAHHPAPGRRSGRPTRHRPIGAAELRGRGRWTAPFGCSRPGRADRCRRRLSRESRSRPAFLYDQRRRGRPRAGSHRPRLRRSQPLRHLLRHPGRAALPARVPGTHAQRDPRRRRATRPRVGTGCGAAQSSGVGRPVRALRSRCELQRRVPGSATVLRDRARTVAGRTRGTEFRTSAHRGNGRHRGRPHARGRCRAAARLLVADREPAAGPHR